MKESQALQFHEFHGSFISLLIELPELEQLLVENLEVFSAEGVLFREFLPEAIDVVDILLLLLDFHLLVLTELLELLFVSVFSFLTDISPVVIA